MSDQHRICRAAYDGLMDEIERALAAIVALPRNMAGDEHYLAVELALGRAQAIVSDVLLRVDRS